MLICYKLDLFLFYDVKIHWPNDAVPPNVYMPVVKEFIEDGSIRAVGISNHGCQDMEIVLDTGASILSNQLPYNLLTRVVEASVGRRKSI